LNLEHLGWNNFFQNQFETINNTSYTPARVIRVGKEIYHLNSTSGKFIGTLSGKLRYSITNIADYPAIGDWVLVKMLNNRTEAVIYHILKRKSCLTRKVPVSGGKKVRYISGRKVTLGGSTEEQVIAANISTIFIVIALDNTFNLKRLERFLLLAYNSGAKPVIILNKIDLCDSIEERVSDIETVAIGVDFHLISAITQEGINELKKYFLCNQTVALFGVSGVGKSTLINSFIQSDLLVTQEVRTNDNKGRHTTTWRELILLPTGGSIIDTPGIRELQIWSNLDNLEEMYDDIYSLTEKCKFNNCSHVTEPNCAIKTALNNGTLSHERFKNFQVMKSEIGYLDKRIAQKEREHNKAVMLSERYMTGKARRDSKNFER